VIDARGYYALLGVASSATEADIRRAFYAKAKELHPDTGELGDPVAFQAVCDAYQVLGDAGRRARYDDLGEPMRLAPTLEWIGGDEPRAPLRPSPGRWRIALGALLIIAFAVLAGTAYLAGAPEHAPSAKGRYESAEPSGPPALSRADAEADAAAAETLAAPAPPEDYQKSRSR
jgi:curved DNA-binding protein CbpA